MLVFFVLFFFDIAEKSVSRMLSLCATTGEFSWSKKGNKGDIIQILI